MSAEAQTISIGQAIDEARWSPYQIAILVFGSLAFCVDGLANQTLSLAMPALTKDWGVTRDAFASVLAVGLFGVLVGNALGGVVGDRFGRRAGTIGSLILFGLATVATSQAKDPGQVMIFRAFAGLGIGGMIPSGAALLAEFTPLRRRSWAIAIGMVFIPVGSTLAGLIAAAVLPRWGWQGLFIADGVLPLASAALFLLVLPESPRFLAGKPEKAAELSRLMARIGVAGGEDTRFVDDQQEVKQPIAALFGGDMGRDTLLLWASFFFVLLGNYTMLNWAPTLVSEQHYPPVVIGTIISAFSFGGIAGGFLAGWSLQQFGSRPASVGLVAGGIAAAAALAVYPFDPAAALTPLFLLVFAGGIFLGGLHTVMYTAAAHAYPPFVRATGVGSAAAFGRLGAVLSSYAGTMAMTAGGTRGFFILIGAVTALALVAIASLKRQIPATGKASADDPAAVPRLVD